MKFPSKTILILMMLLVSPSIVSAQETEHSHEMRTSTPSPHSMHMPGSYGPYPMSREASGTSWQPETTPMLGVHLMKGDWMLMFHAFATGVYDYQSGPRGDDKFFSSNMMMFMAQRPLGSGTLGFRTMFSLEPLMGAQGYPLLFQTGETADGIHPLIDRQHPHDLFMELAATYSLTFKKDGSVFFYFGLPGEPALGPPAFMHRLTGVSIPESPITHHWLDSTHISEGVATLGVVWKNLKWEASAFNGREPDQQRWDIEAPKLQSFAARFSYNPTPAWALQFSYGHLHSPEALEAEINTDRFTFSAAYQHDWKDNYWQALFAWGLNHNQPGRNLNAILLESIVNFHETHSILTRFENVSKDELFEDPNPLAGQTFNISKLTMGYVYNLPTWHHMKWGFGATGSVNFIPETLDSAYGKLPWGTMLFTQIQLD